MAYDDDISEDDEDINSENEKINKIKKENFLISTDKRKKEKPENLKTKKYNKNSQKYRKTVRVSDIDHNYLKINYVIFIIVGLAGIGIGYSILYNSSLESMEYADDKPKYLFESLKSIMEKFKNQERNLWENIYASIKMFVDNPTKPSIIVLLTNNVHTINCLVQSLENVCNDALDTNSLKLNPENFANNTGSVITYMVSELENKKTVIIQDLLKINVEAFKAFHNLCDTINPLIKEVIYIITVIADNYDNNSNPLEFIEKEIWKKLNGKVRIDSIPPLITRITDGVVLNVKSESTFKDCPSIMTTKKFKYSPFSIISILNFFKGLYMSIID